MSTIAERIRLVRLDNNLSQTQFGEKLGITRDAVVNIELDRNRRGTPDNIIKLVTFTFDVNEDWLRTGIGQMYIKCTGDNPLLKQLTDEYKLDGFSKRLVQEYLNLSNQQRSQVKAFLLNLCEADEPVNVES